MKHQPNWSSSTQGSNTLSPSSSRGPGDPSKAPRWTLLTNLLPPRLPVHHPVPLVQNLATLPPGTGSGAQAGRTASRTCRNLCHRHSSLSAGLHDTIDTAHGLGCCSGRHDTINAASSLRRCSGRHNAIDTRGLLGPVESLGHLCGEAGNREGRAALCCSVSFFLSCMNGGPSRGFVFLFPFPFVS